MPTPPNPQSKSATEVTAFQTYDAAENIVHVTFPLVYLETREQIRAHFDRVTAFWRDTCRGQKVYYIV
ncbi:MAG: hypothetical protein ACREJ3_14515, partial [Polyangiaceae bacterium]